MNRWEARSTGEGSEVSLEKAAASSVLGPTESFVHDVKPLGPAATREIGTFALKTKGPNPQEVTGKYVVIWEKVGNDWLAADIWNDGK
jgi:hypothetical protein